MGEVLAQPQVVEETELYIEEAEVQDAVEQLAFPKLDGVLFPIVVENADIVASCSWMGGEEVSLTVALNNYYQPMTEENADEVITDVQDFLANQLRPKEQKQDDPEERLPAEEETPEEEVEPDTVPLRQDNDEEVALPSPPMQQKNLEPPVTTKRDIEPAEPIEKVIEPKFREAVTAKDPVEGEPEPTMEPAALKAPNVTFEVDEEADVQVGTEATLDIAPPTVQMIDNLPVEFAPIQARVQELDAVANPVTPEATSETKPATDLVVDLEASAASVVTSPVDQIYSEVPEQQEKAVVELADVPDENLAPTDEPEAMSEPSESAFLDSAPDDETEPASPDFNPDSRSLDDEIEEVAAAQQPTQRDEPEQQTPTDPAVEKIEQLLAELARDPNILDSETSEPEAVEEEPEHERQNLRALYAELLGDMQHAMGPECEALQSRLLLELQLDDDADILEKLDEIDDPVLYKVVHKTIRAIAAIMTIAKKTLVRMGRSALRLHAIEPMDVYSFA